MKKGGFFGLCLLIAAGALFFRVRDLDRRPMHHDEANQAVKFGDLLERGEYAYDPDDHHGPSLYYLSLPIARAAAGRDFAALDETDLRLVPALFGLGVVLLIFGLMRGLGSNAALAAGAMAALSPAAVFFSRFYIQETLLVFFTAGLILAGWRYRRHPSGGWALAAGLCAGLMFSTKETSLILFGTLTGSVLLTMLTQGPVPGVGTPLRRIRPLHGPIFLGAAALPAVLLFSSFLHHPRGMLDSLMSFSIYFQRAGEAGWHSQPWHYYLGMMTWFRHGAGPVWSEALLLGLGLFGGISAFLRSRRAAPEIGLARFLAFYTLLTTFAYSMISYKTPWNLLPFHLGWICMAGWGAACLAGDGRSRLRSLAVLLLLGAGLWHLGTQSGRAVRRYAADPRNPYVYAHTSPDFLHLVGRVNDIARIHPDGRRMLIRVIADPYRTWPLPWYLRAFERVGYWTDVASAGDILGTPVIICSAGAAETLTSRLEEGYITEFYGLRPGELTAVHIRRDLWNEFMEERSR